MVGKRVKQLRKYLSLRHDVKEEIIKRGRINVNNPTTKKMVKQWKTKSVQEAIKDAETIKKMFYEEGKRVSEISRTLHTRPEYVDLILKEFFGEQPLSKEGGFVPPLKAYEATARHLMGENLTRLSKEIGIYRVPLKEAILKLQDFAVSNPNEFIKEYKRLLLKAGTDKKEVEEKVKKLKKALAQF